MAERLLPDLKINKAEPNEGIKDLLKIIKPHWNLESLKIEPLSGGYSSKIFRCYDETKFEDAVTIRIRDIMEKFADGYKNDMEPIAIQHFSKLGHFPKIYAMFANGYCYQYIKGKPIINARLKTGVMDDEMLRAVAEELVYFHSSKIEGADYSKSMFMDNVNFFLTMPFPDNTEPAPSKEVFLKEYGFVSKLMESLGSPITTLHGDPHPGNIVWDKDKRKVTYVDWEGVSIGYQFQEVGYFLIVIKLFDDSFSETNKNIIFPTDMENKFLRYYCEAWSKIQNEEFTEERFAEFNDTIQKFKLAPILTFMLYGILFPDEFTEICGEGHKQKERTVELYLKVKEATLGKPTFESLD